MPHIVVDELRYHYIRQGSGKSLLLLHGFAGSSESWSTILPWLSSLFDVICIDLPGHGRTAAPTAIERYTMPIVARDVAQIIELIGVSASVLGYSMGGRLALYLALHFPERVTGLILESASPGLEDAVAQRERAESDELLADRILRSGVPAFVADWEKHPIFTSQRRLSPALLDQQRRQRLANSAIGLAGSLRGMGAGRQPNLWPELANLKTPVLLMAGELDEKYVQISRRMVNLLPRAQLQTFPECGHNIHLEQPEAYLACVQGWLG